MKRHIVVAISCVFLTVQCIFPFPDRIRPSTIPAYMRTKEPITIYGTTVKPVRVTVKPVRVTVKPVRVTVTCYKDKGKTAFGYYTKPGTLTVSRDLMEHHGFVPGRKVWLEGFGVLVVADLMHPRWKKRVDVWVPKREKEFKHKDRLAVPFSEEG